MGWLSSLFGIGQKEKVSEQAAQFEQAPIDTHKSMTLAERLAAMAQEDPLFADMADDETDAEAQAIAQKNINKRNVEENCILAGYLLMHSKGIDQEKISECIDLLLRHANQMYQVPMWNFYLGVAYLYSGQVHIALRYLNVAVDDVEFNVSCQKYLTVCINELQMPELNPNFSQDCSKCYEALTAELDSLSAKIKQEFATESGVGHETYRKVSEILSLAFGRTAFNLDVESSSNTARIVLLPVGNIARALQMQFFIDNYPSLFNGKLIVSLARSRNETFSISFKKTQITSKNVKCYLAPSVQGLKVYMYIKELREYLNEDFYGAYKMHLDLFYSAIGELAAACNHITFEALLKNEIPKDSDGQSFTLDRLYNKLIERGLVLDGSNDELLERSFATYENEFQPEPIPDLNEDHEHEHNHAHNHEYEHEHEHEEGAAASAAAQKQKDESKNEHLTESEATASTCTADSANASCVATASASTSADTTTSTESVAATAAANATANDKKASANASAATSVAANSAASSSNTAAATDGAAAAAACSTSPATAVDNRPTYRRDIVKGYTRCYQLIKEYGEVEHRLCDELLERGTVAGFFALKKELFEGDNAKISFEAFTAQFRKSLSSGLNGLSIPLNAKSNTSTHSNATTDSLDDNHGVVGIFVGAAEGLTCYYLDFMSWDTNTLLERTYEILKPLNCYELTYGTFRGDVAALNLVKRPA